MTEPTPAGPTGRPAAGVTDRHGRELPTIIQGGMGVAVSSWQLAREVSQAGHLGVVSGTALDIVLARRLQDGDPSGDLRRAIAAFPDRAVAERIMTKYFRPEGRVAGEGYLAAPKVSMKQIPRSQELAVLANFVEVWLAKEGHDGLVGINFLEKVQMATPAAAYGAVLANVDYVLMGAGIPTEIPRLLDHLALHERGELNVHVDGTDAAYTVAIEPRDILADPPPVRRPVFLAIVSAHVLAAYLAREDSTRPDGFVVEGPTAGGHNAPPRGRLQLDELGQPVFGPRDEADLAKIAAVGLPFWLAGGYATPRRVVAALDSGATGVQIGTLFALADESGLLPEVRETLVSGLRDGTLDVRTDGRASPTGFPFKVAQLPETTSEAATYEARPRLCDLGYLRIPYDAGDGRIGYRCPSEPVDVFVSKGGDIDDTVGRKCLCNGLTANIGIAQTRRDGYTEAAIVTLGGDLNGALALLEIHPQGWTARQAVTWLMSAVSH